MTSNPRQFHKTFIWPRGLTSLQLRAWKMYLQMENNKLSRLIFTWVLHYSMWITLGTTTKSKKWNKIKKEKVILTKKKKKKEACSNQWFLFWQMIHYFKYTNAQNLSKKTSHVSRHFVQTILNWITRKTCHIVVLQANQIWLIERFEATCNICLKKHAHKITVTLYIIMQLGQQAHSVKNNVMKSPTHPLTLSSSFKEIIWKGVFRNSVF